MAAKPSIMWGGLIKPEKLSHEVRLIASSTMTRAAYCLKGIIVVMAAATPTNTSIKTTWVIPSWCSATPQPPPTWPPWSKPTPQARLRILLTLILCGILTLSGHAPGWPRPGSMPIISAQVPTMPIPRPLARYVPCPYTGAILWNCKPSPTMSRSTKTSGRLTRIMCWKAVMRPSVAINQAVLSVEA